MQIEKLEVYRLAQRLGECIWHQVDGWPRFARDTVGRQLVRSADSVSANISEGFGRYHFKKNRNFCYYARGSLFETMTWLDKARARRLLSEDTYEALTRDARTVSVKLNNYIRSIGR